MGAYHDGDEDANLYKPNAWKIALEATHEKPAPSPEIKAAADRLVFAEQLQQAAGWLLLTMMTILLGSLGQLLPVGVCLLSLAVFTLEAVFKIMRNWVHRNFFVDVPCAYVPLHEATGKALSTFEYSLKSALVLELFLYGPYTFFVIQYLIDTRFCETDDSKYCREDGDSTTVFLTLFCCASVLLHGVMSLLAWRAFNAAMEHRSEDEPWDRALCLTWWVHLARHRHLSAVVASKEPMSCGLPGHWFETVDQLKKKMKRCALKGTGDHVLTSEGPLWDYLNMSLGAIICLAKRGENMVCREILSGGGYKLLVQVMGDGKFTTSRGLAAAAVGVLASCRDAVREEEVDLSLAVIPLKRVLRLKEHEVKEAALGALLNIMLNDDQFEHKNVLREFERKEVSQGRSRRGFLQVLLGHAFYGPTTRCQELAIGLLAQLAEHSEDVRNALIDRSSPEQRTCTCTAGVGSDAQTGALDRSGSGPDGSQALALSSHSLRCALNCSGDGGASRGIGRVVELLRHGLTDEIKASAAWVLAELAFKNANNSKNAKTVRKDPELGACTEALIQALEGGSRIVYASTRALHNFAERQGCRRTIVEQGGILKLVELLKSGTRAQRNTSNSITQEQVRAEAAKALLTFCNQTKEYQQPIADAGAIPPLVDLLESPDPKVYMHALSALGGIVSDNKINQDRIYGHGHRVFAKVVQILKEKGRETALDEKGLKKINTGLRKINTAIVSFATKHKGNREMLMGSGAVSALEAIVRDRDMRQPGKAVPKAKEALQSLTQCTD